MEQLRFLYTDVTIFCMDHENFSVSAVFKRSHQKIIDDLFHSVCGLHKISNNTLTQMLHINTVLFSNAEKIVECSGIEEITVNVSINSVIIQLSYHPFTAYDISISVLANETYELLRKNTAHCIYQKKNRTENTTDLYFCWARPAYNIDFFDRPYIHSDQLHARSYHDEIECRQATDLSETEQIHICDHIVNRSADKDASIIIEPLHIYNNNKILCLEKNGLFYGCAIISSTQGHIYERISFFDLMPEYDNPVNRFEFINSYNSDNMILFSEKRAEKNSIISELKGNWLPIFTDSCALSVLNFKENINISETTAVLQYWNGEYIVFLKDWTDNDKKYVKKIIDVCFAINIAKITVLCSDVVSAQAAAYFELLGFSGMVDNGAPLNVLRWGNI